MLCYDNAVLYPHNNGYFLSDYYLPFLTTLPQPNKFILEWFTQLLPPKTT